MWDEIPRRPVYARDPTGRQQIRDFQHMLAVLNHTFGRAPEWTEAAQAVGMVGVPMCAIFDYAMGTPRSVSPTRCPLDSVGRTYADTDDRSGHAAFLDPDVNRMLKKVLNEWGKYLEASEPRPRARVRARARTTDFLSWNPNRRQSRPTCLATMTPVGSVKSATRISWPLPTLRTERITSSRTCTSATRPRNTTASRRGMVRIPSDKTWYGTAGAANT